MLGEYGVSATFNASDLSPFDHDANLRINLFYEEGNETDQPSLIHGAQGIIGDLLMLSNGSITRSRIKKFGVAMSSFIQGQVTQEPNELTFNKCCRAWKHT